MNNKIRIEFLIDFRSFKKGSVYEFATDKAIIIVGDNGTGKSTLMNILYCHFIRSKLCKDGYNDDSLQAIQYKALFGSPKSHARYIYHNVFNIAKVTYPDNFYFYKYSTSDYSIETADSNDPRISSDVFAKQVYLNSMSRGEVEFENLTDFINEFKSVRNTKFDNWVIFDEPDNSLSIRHSKILPYYFDYNTPGKILILHHPYTIELAEKVYYLKKVKNDTDESVYVSMSVCSGVDFLNDMLKESEKCVEEMLGGKK